MAEFEDEYWGGYYPQRSDLARMLARGSAPDFMFQHHSRELARGGVRNPNGSVSTYYGMTAPDESGRQRMLPTIWDGNALSPRDAYARAQAQGLWRYPGSFSAMRALYNYMNDPNQHPRMEQDLAGYLQRNALDK